MVGRREREAAINAGPPRALHRDRCVTRLCNVVTINRLLRNLRVGAVILATFAVVGAFVVAAGAEPNCTCRARGRSFELGQSACLQTPKGPRIAVCVMVLNNTSWQISETPCIGADARPPGQVMAR
jgi:hypothetical protein